MKDQSELKFRKTLEDIRFDFDFLFERGFRIASILFPNPHSDNWQVNLLEGNCFIHLYSDMGIINLTMSILQRSSEIVFFDLESVNSNRDFFYIPDEFPRDEAQQFKKIAAFLEKHFVEILAQAKKDNLPIITHLLNDANGQSKRTSI